MFAEFSLPDTFWIGAVGSFVYGFIGLLLMIFGVIILEVITRRLQIQDELKKGNTAVAIVVAAVIGGVAYVAAHVVH